MQPIFDIKSPVIDTATAQLALELGPDGMTIVILDGNNSFASLTRYAFLPGNNETDYQLDLEGILEAERLIGSVFKKIVIIWSFPESILVPPEYMNRELSAGMMDLVFGDLETTNCRTDFLIPHNLHNLYRVPALTANSFDRWFPAAGQIHQFSLLADFVHKEGNHLQVIFYATSLTAMLSRDGNILMIRNFNYHVPVDAAWILLNCCERFNTLPDETLLHVSGMIDTSSGLYAELYKYFLHVKLDLLPANAEYFSGVSSLPEHYFSYLFASVLCV